MKTKESNSSRRDFLSKTIPVCALFCFARPALPLISKEVLQDQMPKHKFDALYRKDVRENMTYRQYFNLKFGDLIKLCKNLEPVIGKEKFLEMIRETTTKELMGIAKQQAQRHGEEAGFKKFTDQFRGNYQDVLTFEIAKDTDTEFEMNVTECIWADVFKELDAVEYGEARVCHGDYAWAKGYHKNLRMERDKTLMKGDACCNHCFIWE